MLANDSFLPAHSSFEHHRVLISTFVLFMRTGIRCLTQYVFSFELLYLSPSSVSFSIFLFCCTNFYLFCSSSVFSVIFSFCTQIFTFAFCACSLSRCSYTLSLSFSLSHDFGSLFAVSFSFIPSFLFFLAFFISLTFLFLISRFLFFSFFGCLLPSFFYLYVFGSIFLFPVVFRSGGSLSYCFCCIVFFLFFPLSSISIFLSSR